MPSTLTQALPQGFDFYHLGRIDLEPGDAISSESAKRALASDHFGIGYRFEGEARGGLILLVGEGLDPSVYSEAGNIIASRIASSLSGEGRLEVAVSPPLLLTRLQLTRLLASEDAVVRLYVHRQEHRAIPLQAVLLPSTAFSPLDSSEEASGNA
jgi:hypothetical protein